MDVTEVYSACRRIGGLTQSAVVATFDDAFSDQRRQAAARESELKEDHAKAHLPTQDLTHFDVVFTQS